MAKNILLFISPASLCYSFNFIFHPSIEEILLHLAAVMIILIYMFMPNYYGQEITDYSNGMYIAA